MSRFTWRCRSRHEALRLLDDQGPACSRRTWRPRRTAVRAYEAIRDGAAGRRPRRAVALSYGGLPEGAADSGAEARRRHGSRGTGAEADDVRGRMPAARLAGRSSAWASGAPRACRLSAGQRRRGIVGPRSRQRSSESARLSPGARCLGATAFAGSGAFGWGHRFRRRNHVERRHRPGRLRGVRAAATWRL